MVNYKLNLTVSFGIVSSSAAVTENVNCTSVV